jgi:hypothetical protein
MPDTAPPRRRARVEPPSADGGLREMREQRAAAYDAAQEARVLGSGGALGRHQHQVLTLPLKH